MFTHKNLMTVCCAAVLALGLAACGGGGGDGMPAVVDNGDNGDNGANGANGANGDTVLTPEEMAAEAAAATKAAGTKLTEIGDEAIQGTDAGLGGTGITSVTMTIERDADGTTVKITDTAQPAEQTPANPQFMQAMDLGDGTTMHVRDNGMGEEEVVVVTTDIEAPTDIPFVLADDNMGRYTLDPDENFLTFNMALHTGRVTLTDSRASVPAPAGTVSLTGVDAAATENVKENQYRGTFDGAPGTFTCIGGADGCDVTVEDGEITDMDTVHFTPDEDVTVKEDDADYLNYGFWLMRTTDADGAITYDEVQTFAGSELARSGNVDTVDGSATYEGGATGVYVKNVYSAGGGMIESATSGVFTADAMLTATFGQTVDRDIPPNETNTLTGTISHFALQHGEENDWSVNLQGDIAENGDTVTSAGGATGGGAPGSWSATFYGPTPVTADTEDGDVTVAPGSVVGEFNANFSNGSVAGGFGARKQ